jgi:hypothetical protein
MPLLRSQDRGGAFSFKHARLSVHVYAGTRLSILDGYLHDTLTDALSGFDLPMACVVTRTESSGPEWDPVMTPVPYAASGWIDQYQAAEHVDSSILVNDRKVYVVASTLAIVPVPGNTIAIAGSSFTVIATALDPAGVAWVMQCRI